MADKERHQRPLHVVVFPWLAHGHITPLVELSKNLVSNGLRISFVSTPLNVARIKQQVLQTGIELVELPMPSVDGLPTGVESTADLSKIGGLGLIPLLYEAMDHLEKPFEALLKLLSPDFVIHDIVQYWTPRVATKLGIPTVTFASISAAGISYGHGHALHQSPTADDLTIPPPGFPSSVVRRQLFDARKALMALYQQTEKSAGPTFMVRRSICFEENWAIACNTCVELEGAYLDYLQTITGRPVFPVGILMPDLPPRPAADPCLTWLDRQPVGTVVFASFGSECLLTGEEVSALAAGMEDSGMPFIWVLPLHGATLALPHGFEDRCHGRGLVVTHWAPQLHILDHPSIGAFLTHCGWNSVTEGLRFAVPFLALPMQFDQGLNASLISQELKLGVEISRNEDNGSFTKEDVSKAVRTMMVEEQGKLIKSNVEQTRKVLTGNDCRGHRTSIENFVSLLKEKALNKQTSQ